MARLLVLVRRAYSILLAALSLVGLGWLIWWRRQHRTREYDKEATDAQNEASKVRDAGGRGAADEVLESFRKATDK